MQYGEIAQGYAWHQPSWLICTAKLDVAPCHVMMEVLQRSLDVESQGDLDERRHMVKSGAAGGDTWEE